MIKGFHQSFLQNEVDFRDIQTFSQISCQKTETRFWKSTDNDINIFLSLENTEKKRPENVFLPLIVNYRKIVHKNKLYDSKQ